MYTGHYYYSQQRRQQRLHMMLTPLQLGTDAEFVGGRCWWVRVAHMRPPSTTRESPRHARPAKIKIFSLKWSREIQKPYVRVEAGGGCIRHPVALPGSGAGEGIKST